ncbi:hypothetical protein [Microbacterium paraoxydans]|uniref:hypothetical protein n=1 Tax=Microbacterium paraoxydans TaxID=199592 RepID=UPI001CFC20E8|nr:hypothetical protein [Microbacterium paraoxydans]
MQPRTDAEELRALQQRAYGRGAQLTEREAERLRALEEARRSPIGSAPPDDDVAAEEDSPAEGGSPAEEAPAPALIEPSVPVAPAVSDEPGPRRGAVRVHLVSMIVAVAVVLAIGVGAGWALFSPRIAGIPLTGEQQQRRAELSASTFDPGSVRAIAGSDDALVWYATRDDGALSCMILDVSGRAQTDCLPGEEVGNGLTAVLPVEADGTIGEDSSGDGAFGVETVIATLRLSVDGEPMAGIQRWGGPSSLAAQFPHEVRDRAEELVADGFGFGLSLISMFRGEPVWLADRLSAQGTTDRCLIVDAGGPVACAPFETAVASGLATQVVDGGSGDGRQTITALELRFTGQQYAYLDITEGVPAATVTPGESFFVEAPPGDPIEIAPPGAGTGG